MNFEPDYAQQQWLKKMKTLSDNTIGSCAMEVDEEKFIPRENFQALVETGFSGLVISEEIINRHNGKIWVESEFGRGTVFYFTLPI